MPGLRETLPNKLRVYLLNNVVLSTTEATPRENDDGNRGGGETGPTGATNKNLDDTSYSGAVPEHATHHQNNRKSNNDTIEGRW